MGRKLWLCWVPGLIAIACPSPVHAQSSVEPPVRPPVASTRATDLRISPRAGAGYSTSGGGYDGFGSFEGFIPLTQTPGKDLLYLVGRLLLDNDAQLGGNLLVGYRFYNPSANLIYGGYLGYDSRSTGESVFSQLGLGFEALGDGWDARINGYIPVGNTRQTISEQVFDTGTQLSNFRFEDHFLRASGSRQQQLIRNLEVAMAGFDVEAGGRLFKFGNGGDLRGYAGLYYLSGGENSAGVRGRLEARPIDFLTLGIAVQHDSIFGTNVIGTVALSFPGSRPRGADPTSVQARMGEMPYRVNAIAVDSRTEVKQISTPIVDAILINPATGQPYFFQHVNLGVGGSDGTFEYPFGTVQQALNATRSDGNDIVYVQAGTNPGIPAFTIPDRVQVLSTGSVQRVPAIISGQFFPAYPLPLSGSGTLPSVTGTVTMQSDTVLSGFNITSTTGAGVTFSNVNRVEIRDNVIRNTASAGILGNGVANANLFRNQITAAQDQGIYLQNVGTATVTDNSVASTRAGTTTIANPITGDITIGSITIPNPGSIIPLPSGQGIAIATTTGGVTVARNTITGTGTQGLVLLNARGNASITDNTVANTVGNDFTVPVPTIGNVTVTTGQGIVVSGVNGNLDVSRNTVNTVRGQGIAVAGVTNGTTTISSNTVRNTVDQGMVVAGTSGTTNIANNQISDVATRNITIANPTGIGPATLTVATGQGLLLINSINAVNVSGNTIERVAGNFSTSPAPDAGQGIAVANFAGSLDLNITNNQIRTNYNDGILIGLAGRPSGTTTAATANITLSNNTIENNGGAAPVRGDGIAIGLEQDAVVNNLLIDNNTIRNNGDEGIDIRLGLQAIPLVNPTTAQLVGTIQNNTIANNGQNGVQVQARGSTTARVAINSNTINANGIRGIDLSTASLLLLGTPTLFANIRQNTFTGANSQTVQAQTTSSPLVAQTLCVNLSGNNFITNLSTINLIATPNLPAHNFTANLSTISPLNNFPNGGVISTPFGPPTNVATCP